MKGYAYNRFRLFGFYQDSECTIYHGDPGAGGVEVSANPYQCTTAGSGGQEWQLNFTVSVAPAQVVTDPKVQDRLLAKACSDAANCGYVPTSITETAGTPPTPVGHMIVNRTSSNTTQEVAWAKTTTTSHSFGYKATDKVILPGVELSVELSYGYTATNSYTAGEKDGLTAKPGEEAWFSRRGLNTSPVTSTFGQTVCCIGCRTLRSTSPTPPGLVS